MSGGGYGIPLICPKCPRETAHRILKTPRMKAPNCADCGTPLVPVDPVRRVAWEAKRDHSPA